MIRARRVRTGASILWTVAAVALAARAQSSENPLRGVFPYGVYIAGNNPDGTVRDIRDIEQVRAAIERACKDIAAHNMNAVWPNNLLEQHLPAWLEAGRKNGIRVVPQSGGPPTFVRAQFYKDKQDLVAQVSGAYRKLIDRHGSDTALLAWSLGEESNPLDWVYEGAAEVVRLMAEWDPEHPAIMQDNKTTSAALSARIVKPKAMILGCYPYFANPESGPVTATGSRSYWTRQCTRIAHTAASIDAPFWMMGQGMQLWHMRGEKPPLKIWRWPTPAEIRWQVWSAIQHGAKGFFFFVYHGPWRQPGSPGGESMDGLRDHESNETPQFRAAAETGALMQQLAATILTLDVASVGKQVEYWENTAVSARTHVQRETGRRFLSAVNNDWETPQQVGVDLGYWPGLLRKDEQLFDLRSGRVYDKTAILAPGDGTLYFVGTETDWNTFAAGLDMATRKDGSE